MQRNRELGDTVNKPRDRKLQGGRRETDELCTDESVGWERWKKGETDRLVRKRLIEKESL